MLREPLCLNFFFFNDTATTEIYTLSLHDALPIYLGQQYGKLAEEEVRLVLAVLERIPDQVQQILDGAASPDDRSEEHTSELQSLTNLVCRLLLEKKNTPLLEAHGPVGVDDERRRL